MKNKSTQTADRPTRRLQLAKQTLRHLSNQELGQVVGGGRISGGITAACSQTLEETYFTTL